MRRPTRILALAAIAPLAAVALAACTQAGPLPTLTTRTPSGSSSPTPTVEPGLSPSAIADLAVRAVGEGTAVAVEDEADGREWDVRVVLDSGAVQEVHLDRQGTVLAGPSEDPTDADEQSDNRADVAAVSLELRAAQRRMLAAVPGGRVTEIELDDYQDRVVWQGDVVDGQGVRHDVRIDAVNGSVLLERADVAATPPTGS